MKIYPVYNHKKSCNQKFGMALEMNEENIGDVISDFAGAEARRARSQLESLAKDVDIVVHPVALEDKKFLSVMVREVVPPANPNSIISIFWRELKIAFKPHSLGGFYVKQGDVRIAEQLIGTAKLRKVIFSCMI